MRTFHDLSPGDQSTYRIYQERLKDRTLSAAQHDECRRQIDNLLWAGPNGQLIAVKAELKALEARLERLEFHAGFNDSLIDAPPPPASDGPKVVRADCGNTVTPTEKIETTVAPPADFPERENDPKKETRGRKAKRFHPEKNANKEWMVLDREAGEYTSHGPYKTRREAKEMVDTLNNMPNQPPVPIDAPDPPAEEDPLADLGF